MMVFDNEDFGKVRVIGCNENPLFNLEDVGFALGYITVAKGKEYLHKARIRNVLENGSIPTVVHDVQHYIDEDGLYELILESRTDKARGFRKWVTSEVLPSVRRDGSFDVVENNLQKIDDDEEKKLSLLVHSLEKTFEIDPSNVTIGILLGQAKADLQSYKVQQSIDEVKEDVAKIRQQGAWVGDRTTFNDKVQILARKFFNKDIKEAYDMLYARMRQLDGFDVNARMRIAKEKLNQERIEKVGKPYAESTLKQRVTGLDVIEENDKWTVASEAYNSIENEMYELRQG